MLDIINPPDFSARILAGYYIFGRYCRAMAAVHQLGGYYSRRGHNL